MKLASPSPSKDYPDDSSRPEHRIFTILHTMEIAQIPTHIIYNLLNLVYFFPFFAGITTDFFCSCCSNLPLCIENCIIFIISLIKNNQKPIFFYFISTAFQWCSKIFVCVAFGKAVTV